MESFWNFYSKAIGYIVDTTGKLFSSLSVVPESKKENLEFVNNIGYTKMTMLSNSNVIDTNDLK